MAAKIQGKKRNGIAARLDDELWDVMNGAIEANLPPMASMLFPEPVGRECWKCSKRLDIAVTVNRFIVAGVS